MLLEHVFPQWKRAELAEVFIIAVGSYGLVAAMIMNVPVDEPQRTEQPDCVVMSLDKN